MGYEQTLEKGLKWVEGQLLSQHGRRGQSACTPEALRVSSLHSQPSPGQRCSETGQWGSLHNTTHANGHSAFVLGLSLTLFCKQTKTLLPLGAALCLHRSALQRTSKSEDQFVLFTKSSVAGGVAGMAAEMLQHFSLCKNENDSGQMEEKYIFMQDKDLEHMQGSYDPQSNHNLTTLHA